MKMILISDSWIYTGESKDANKKWVGSEDELNFALFHVVIRFKYLCLVSVCNGLRINFLVGNILASFQYF